MRLLLLWLPEGIPERGIKKAAGDVGNVNYEYVTYEGYGPSGTSNPSGSVSTS